MNFTESITTCFTKFFTIKGRASRSEYWWFHLMWVICYFILFLTADQTSQFTYALYWMTIGVLVISFIPLFTASIRRLHDCNKSGAYLFFSLIPFIGSFIVIFMLIPEGTKGQNRFGKNPLSKR
jgi:uncharacterized membrane protein YhaH (DUF805 family)